VATAASLQHRRALDNVSPVSCVVCVPSQTTAGANTRRVLRARGAEGAEFAMQHCLL